MAKKITMNILDIGYQSDFNTNFDITFYLACNSKFDQIKSSKITQILNNLLQIKIINKFIISDNWIKSQNYY